MSNDQELRAICKNFFDTVERGDIDGLGKLYSADAKIWHNTDDYAQSREENLATLKGGLGRFKSRAYVDRQVQTFPGGFVQQHRLKAERHDGSKAELIAVCICKVNGEGKVSRLDEYFDSAAVARFRGEAK